MAPDRLAANPDLMNKTAIEIHDDVVRALTDANVMVILNNHVCSNYFFPKFFREIDFIKKFLNFRAKTIHFFR